MLRKVMVSTEHHGHHDISYQYECDGICDELCWEDGCDRAVRCPFCGDLYCMDQHDSCPTCHEEENDECTNDG